MSEDQARLTTVLNRQSTLLTPHRESTEEVTTPQGAAFLDDIVNKVLAIRLMSKLTPPAVQIEERDCSDNHVSESYHAPSTPTGRHRGLDEYEEFCLWKALSPLPVFIGFKVGPMPLLK